jgi:predicted Zn-dependent peptidase
VDVFSSAPSKIAAVTLPDVASAAQRTLATSNRTIGWFDPLPV